LFESLTFSSLIPAELRESIKANIPHLITLIHVDDYDARGPVVEALSNFAKYSVFEQRYPYMSR